MSRREPLIFELSGEGKRAFFLPPLDIPDRKQLLEIIKVRDSIPGFPEVTEPEIGRHFTRLSQTNFCVDTSFYPLGSCTMKYSPKINEKIASLPHLLNTHPLAPEDLVQGNLEIIKLLEDYLCRITGMDFFTLWPAAGLDGELTGMMMNQGCPHR